MGLILVFFFFQNRGCSWLPENKVKDTILRKIIVSENPTFKIDSMESFFSNYEVDFSQSSKDSIEKTYFFKIKEGVKSKTPSFYVSFWPDSYVAVIHHTKSQLKKVNADVFYKIIHVPSDQNSLINFDEATFLQKKLSQFKLDQSHYSSTLSNSGYLRYNHSKPNSDQVLIKTIYKKDTIQIIYQWKENVLYPKSID